MHILWQQVINCWSTLYHCAGRNVTSLVYWLSIVRVRETGWSVFWTGGAVWPANWNKVDKDCSQHTLIYRLCVPLSPCTDIHTRTHRCLVTGWALGLMAASARGGWVIVHPSRSPNSQNRTTTVYRAADGDWLFGHKARKRYGVVSDWRQQLVLIFSVKRRLYTRAQCHRGRRKRRIEKRQF